MIKESDKENGGEIRGKGMGRDGHLSSRMRLPGNLWRQMWKVLPLLLLLYTYYN